MGLKRQMARLEFEELTSAYEYARERYIACPHWDRGKDALKEELERTKAALTSFRNRLYGE